MSDQDPNDLAEEEFDLDEDIFGFDPIEKEDVAGDDFDLDEIIASFRDGDEQVEPAGAGLVSSSDDDDEIIGSEDDDETRVPEVSRRRAAAATPVAAAGSLSKPMILVFLALTVVNAAFAALALKSSGSVRTELQGVNEAFERALTEAASVREQAQNSTSPIPVPNDAETFEPELAGAQADLDAGLPAAARRRVYSMLARIDRLAPARREINEAAARFLIAETYQAEALIELGAER